MRGVGTGEEEERKGGKYERKGEVREEVKVKR
jgi:hypothetical protein